MLNKSLFKIEKELAEGSYGNVFSVSNVSGLPSNGSYVYKEYKSYARPNATKLSSFVDFYYNLTPSAKEYLDTICSWPHEVVQDKGTVSGFLMPRIPRKFNCNINFSGGTKNVEAKFEHLLIPDSLLKRRHIPLTSKKRYKLLRAIVKELDFFHEHKICIGDFSHSNILFSLNDCKVFFLDCDSFSIKGSTVFPQTETGNWGVAEQYPDEELGTNKSDIYKLGLLALRLLMNSDNPTFYQATKNTSYLPSNVDMGVRDIIENSLKDEGSRPSLAEWSLVLSKAIKNCAAEEDIVTDYVSTIPDKDSNISATPSSMAKAPPTGQQTYPNGTQYSNQPIGQQNNKGKNYKVVVGLVSLAIIIVLMFWGTYVESSKREAFEQEVAEQEAAERKVAERKVAEQEAAERKEAEREEAERKGAEQEAAEREEAKRAAEEALRVQDFTLNATTIWLELGETFQLEVDDIVPTTARDADIRYINEFGHAFSVSEKGLVTAPAYGVYTTDPEEEDKTLSIYVGDITKEVEIRIKNSYKVRERDEKCNIDGVDAATYVMDNTLNGCEGFTFKLELKSGDLGEWNVYVYTGDGNTITQENKVGSINVTQLGVSYEETFSFSERDVSWILVRPPMNADGGWNGYNYLYNVTKIVYDGYVH